MPPGDRLKAEKPHTTSVGGGTGPTLLFPLAVMR